jgi:hypothetical protein
MKVLSGDSLFWLAAKAGRDNSRITEASAVRINFMLPPLISVSRVG